MWRHNDRDDGRGNWREIRERGRMQTTGTGVVVVVVVVGHDHHRVCNDDSTVENSTTFVYVKGERLGEVGGVGVGEMY